MMRINLLPPEIVEKRRAEHRVVYLGLGAGALFLVLAIVWAVAATQVAGKQRDLDAKQQQVQLTQAKADKLAIFEQKEQDLKKRQSVAQQALSGRQNWAKLCDEISLVLPTDVWLTTMSFDEAKGFTIAGYAVDDPTDSPDVGQKTIAKTLVRLADLDGVYNVWLTSSVKALYEDNDVLQFALTTSLRPSQTASSTASTGATGSASSTGTTH